MSTYSPLTNAIRRQTMALAFSAYALHESDESLAESSTAKAVILLSSYGPFAALLVSLWNIAPLIKIDKSLCSADGRQHKQK
jgi:hypothetical protein